MNRSEPTAAWSARSAMSRSARMPNRVALVLALALGFASVALADDVAYRECTIANGQVSWCGPWYQGEAVVHHDDAYRTCSIANGQVVSCGPWYQGDAVIYRDEAFRTCTIANGQPIACGPWHQGTAVVRR